jgi:protein involved in polysaccharide export with SLBB domain
MPLPGVDNRQKTLELSVPMKRIFLVLAFLLAAVAPAAAQTQDRERRLADNGNAPAAQQPAVRNRVVGDTNRSNHANKEVANVTSPATGALAKPDDPKPAWGNTSVPTKNSVTLLPPPSTSKPNQPGNSAPQKLVKPTSFAVENGSVAANLRASVPVSTNMTSLYRVGIGDVLDIRLVNVVTKESTLFTVMKEGVVEYPLLPRPILVTGMTTDEIARRLKSEIKVIKDARVVVSVRDFASHSVIVTGLVDNPGRKALRREVMPLFAILAECLPRSEAAMATIIRNGRETNLSLANSQDMSMLIMSGDTIKISAAPKHFVYLGGDVASAGEKEFREGMTLTQAILAAGGPRDVKSKVKVARRNANGFLATEEFNLAAITDGKAADPLLQAGDRIEVQRGVW